VRFEDLVMSNLGEWTQTFRRETGSLQLSQFATCHIREKWDRGSTVVAGSIPDGVIGIFHRHNPSDRTMALGSTQPLKEMSTNFISWG